MGETQTAYLSNDNRVFFSGRKLHYKPKLFEIDYEQFKVRDFCATDKGVAVLTEDGRLFFNGNFWRGKLFSENNKTGIKEIDVEKAFDGSQVVGIGGSLETKFALVK